jgi:hypothetical protein
MRKNSIIALTFLLLAVASCKKYDYSEHSNTPQQYQQSVEKAISIAGNNSSEMERALSDAPEEQKNGMAFLIAYMPKCDLTTLKADLLLENVAYAYKARNEFKWAKNLPDSIFLNEVLPYYNLNEHRDNWRADFYNRFKKYVQNCETTEQAIQAINQNIKQEVKVEYNTKRWKADQSPYESMKQGMASCSGLSILLADALRAVGIPARIAGCPLWYDDSGNHNWVEVWIDGKWLMTEYGTTDALNTGWVVAKAGKSNPNVRERAIYAASYKPADTSFCLVWDTLNTLDWVHAYNVSQRYIDLYANEKNEHQLQPNEIETKVWCLKNAANGLQSDNRIRTQVSVYEQKSDTLIAIESGATPDAQMDMNNYLFFILEKGKHYVAKYLDANGKPQMKNFIASDTLLL